MTSDEALSMAGIVKRFGRVAALDNADLVVNRGTIHALLGENGAGKTTLMRVAFGLVPLDSGAMTVWGQAYNPGSARDAIRAGLGMVHQHYAHVAAMTVAENVVLGERGLFRKRVAEREVAALAQRSGLPVDPSARVGALSVSMQQRVEILKAMRREARILILDEPTALLAPAEANELLQWLRGYADRGGTAVLITHKLREAAAWANDVTVLRAGHRVLANAVASTSLNEIASAMLGDTPSLQRSAVESAAGAVVASTRGMTAGARDGSSRIVDAAMDVRAGEIVGIAAVEGAGHAPLLEVLAGRLRPAVGKVTLPSSVAYVPADRHRDALVLDMSLTENVALKGAGQRRGVLRWRDLAAKTARMVGEQDVRGASAGANRTIAAALSGGNQQKLVVARELDDAPALVVADNPTRGLDFRAAQAVHDRLRAARDRGAAIVIYSSDIDETLGLASRMFAVHAGTLREVPVERSSVGAAMLGMRVNDSDAA